MMYCKICKMILQSSISSRIELISVFCLRFARPPCTVKSPTLGVQGITRALQVLKGITPGENAMEDTTRVHSDTGEVENHHLKNSSFMHRVTSNLGFLPQTVDLLVAGGTSSIIIPSPVHISCRSSLEMVPNMLFHPLLNHGLWGTSILGARDYNIL
jgi:hypothetical protein